MAWRTHLSLVVRNALLASPMRTPSGSELFAAVTLKNGDSLLAVAPAEAEDDLLMITRRGVIKKTLLSDFEYQRRGGKIAITLDEGDELLYVTRTDGTRELMIATRSGIAVRFAESGVRPMGRLARGA